MRTPDDRDRSEQNESHRLPPGRPVAMQAIPDSPRYSMADLEAATGLTARTIRYYVTEHILKPAQGRGPASAYSKDHLLRLKMIEELKTTENLPLEKIRERLLKLSTSDLEAHFAIATRAVEGRWRRVLFHPDLELHIREQSEPDYQFERAVDLVIQYARFTLEQLEVT